MKGVNWVSVTPWVFLIIFVVKMGGRKGLSSERMKFRSESPEWHSKHMKGSPVNQTPRDVCTVMFSGNSLGLKGAQ